MNPGGLKDFQSHVTCLNWMRNLCWAESQVREPSALWTTHATRSWLETQPLALKHQTSAHLRKGSETEETEERTRRLIYPVYPQCFSKPPKPIQNPSKSSNRPHGDPPGAPVGRDAGRGHATGQRVGDEEVQEQTLRAVFEEILGVASRIVTRWRPSLLGWRPSPRVALSFLGV